MRQSPTVTAGLAVHAKRQLAQRQPSLYADLGRLRRYLRRHRPGHVVRWGNTRRFRAYSDAYGFERGRPVDRYYIEVFLGWHRQDLRGVALEVRDPWYTGAVAGLERVEVLDKDPTNDMATVHADLDLPDALPPDRFDCIVLTQVLQYTEPVMCLRNLWRALRSGGVLLLSVPSMSRVDPNAVDDDRWRWTPAGLRTVLSTAGLPADEVVGFGNLVTCQAALLGLAAEDLRGSELDLLDPAYPLLACARVVKP